jgi:hypothetical protein
VVGAFLRREAEAIAWSLFPFELWRICDVVDEEAGGGDARGAEVGGGW